MNLTKQIQIAVAMADLAVCAALRLVAIIAPAMIVIAFAAAFACKRGR